MSSQEALKRAGSPEALLAAAREGRIMVRHNGLYSDAKMRPLSDNLIPPHWWEEVQNVDFSIGRVTFFEELEVVAIGIELERAAVEARWPGKPKPAGSQRGPKPRPEWDDIIPLLNDFANAEQAFHGVKLWLEKKKKPKMHDTTIKNGIRRYRPDWFRA